MSDPVATLERLADLCVADLPGDGTCADTARRVRRQIRSAIDRHDALALLRGKRDGAWYPDPASPDAVEALGPDETCGWRLYYAPIGDET